jgi:hypothetical protein
MSQSDTDFENETKAFVDVVISNLPASSDIDLDAYAIGLDFLLVSA